MESQTKVVAGYSYCATGKELKLSGSQGMYVVFEKVDQGSGLGQIVRWSGLFVEEVCSVVSERLVPGFGCEQKVAEKCSTFSHREVKDQVLVVKRKLKWG
ncbi:hypothetical protein Bca52824_034885 [Brassica carinata]|uniref:Uncharacterized protein n=1 Tax=Brassica carinata TaxID=52824 RepID=A0A8X7S392_BRACI|nr:hypothetical protein Bca52824_034885 [Brassica carinata]